MKHTKCPYCGSKKGFVGEDVPMMGFHKLLFTPPPENAPFGKMYYEIIEETWDIDYRLARDSFNNPVLVCSDCGEEICTFDEMF